MTPPATARSSQRSAAGSRRRPAPRPRRISGPTGSTRSGAVAAAVAIPAPGIALPRERKSRPGSLPRTRPARKTTRRPAQGAPGIALRAIDAFEGVSSSVFLDRLIRGRLWIGLLAFALIGIVAMQLLVLKLNTGIGHTLGRVETLQRENAQLGIEDSMYSAEGRVAPLAAAQGMTLAPPGTVHFVVASKADISRAASALSSTTQTPASLGASSTTAGEPSVSPASSETEAQASTGAGSQASGSSGEVSGESSSSAGAGEVAAGPSESSASVTPSSSPESAASPSSQPAATPSAAGAQEAGASATPSSSEASATQASGPAGGTQAGARE
ncbi:MAG TPA: hypothetical protein VIJ39_04075 [Solirubrobacteraceae bacterium]